MVDYYRRRAAYYERVYFKPERQADLREMEAWVARLFAGRRVLEVATGTGWWTVHGARHAADWLATDLNPETLAVARAKALPACVRLAEADAYALQGLGPGPFDAAFAGCWVSHVPLSRLSAWVDTLHAALQPGARVVVLDNSFVQTSSTPLTRRDEEGNTYQNRTLDDGSVHEVLKNFPTAEGLRTQLGARATGFEWTEWTHYWAAAWTRA
ncbi:MAG: class I SAM-dependent methyltransferase [Rubrivivax sp.]|nr:class I SAM-dependent methyltransferase [Rubrivivax sp.]